MLFHYGFVGHNERETRQICKIALLPGPATSAAGAVLGKRAACRVARAQHTKTRNMKRKLKNNKAIPSSANLPLWWPHHGVAPRVSSHCFMLLRGEIGVTLAFDEALLCFALSFHAGDPCLGTSL